MPVAFFPLFFSPAIRRQDSSAGATGMASSPRLKSRSRLNADTSWRISSTREPVASKSLQDRKTPTIQMARSILKPQSWLVVTGSLQQGFYVPQKTYRLHDVIRLAWRLLHIQTRAKSSEIRHEHRLQPGSGINQTPTAAPRFMPGNFSDYVSVCDGRSWSNRSPSRIRFGRAADWGSATNFLEW